MKYTPQGGFVRLQITEYPSFLRLDISDSGVGIPEEEQAKIFSDICKVVMYSVLSSADSSPSLSSSANVFAAAIGVFI